MTALAEAALDWTRYPVHTRCIPQQAEPGSREPVRQTQSRP